VAQAVPEGVNPDRFELSKTWDTAKPRVQLPLEPLNEVLF